MLDPQLVIDGDGACAADGCEGYATFHSHPHYPYVDVDCESCGTYVLDLNVEPGDDGHLVRYPSDAELLHRLEVSPPGREPEGYRPAAGPVSPPPPDSWADDEPF
jgi:hypothetical protein